MDERTRTRPRRRSWHVVTSVWGLVTATLEGFVADRVPRMAASLAYYTLFSLAPVLVIAAGIAGIAFGEDAARGQIVQQIQGLIGREGAEAVQAVLRQAHPGQGLAATVLGIVTLLVGATGAFVELQDALNVIWGVVPKPGHAVLDLLKIRLLSFLMVLVIGFLLLVSLVLSAGLEAAATYVQGQLAMEAGLMQFVNSIFSFVVITVLFALLYLVLPDARIGWRDVWVGAAITSVLFSLGKKLIGLYLARSSITSMYGAAGSVVILVIWVFYTATILFLGAEFTRVYATRFGGGIAADPHAVLVEDVVDVQIRRSATDDEPTLATVKEEARRQVEDAVRALDEKRDS